MQPEQYHHDEQSVNADASDGFGALERDPLGLRASRKALKSALDFRTHTL
jgi:hypothetical protein